MRRLKILVSLMVAVFASGCATTDSVTIAGHTFDQMPCTLVGAAIGGAAAGAASGGPGAPFGVLGGAIIAPLFCGDDPDSDGDGVPDRLDQCPDTPAGVAVDEVGCPLDSDGDGVDDYLDQCPNTPAGVAVDEVGCPLDSDGDGVPDHLDQCPGTPAGTEVDEVGCPVPQVLIESIHFDFDSATVKPISRAVLDARALRALRANPSLRLRIEGHTDSVGTDRYNQGLSERRAQAVKDYLVSQGINPNRLETVGYGESRPVDSNEAAAGRANNRRVEFVVLN